MLQNTMISVTLTLRAAYATQLDRMSTATGTTVYDIAFCTTILQNTYLWLWH